MKKQRYICKSCRHEFEREVFEDKEEAEKSKVLYRIRCPKCGSTFLEKI